METGTQEENAEVVSKLPATCAADDTVVIQPEQAEISSFEPVVIQTEGGLISEVSDTTTLAAENGEPCGFTVSLTVGNGEEDNLLETKMAVGENQHACLEGQTAQENLVTEPIQQAESVGMQVDGGANETVIAQNNVTNEVEDWKDIENIVDIDPSSTAGYLILSKEAAASLGMDSSDGGQIDGEPATKRFRIEGGDGQSYVLSVAPDDTCTMTAGETTDKIETDQTNTGPVIVGCGETVTSQVAPSGNRKALENSDISQAWFTTRDEKDALHSKGATWKQGQWTKEEVEILQENINRYCADRNIIDPTTIIFEMSKDERKDFYRCIARGLQRPLFSVYRRVTRMYDQKNHIGKYTPDEINKLKELRSKFGNDWASIGAALGRSASSVKDKFRLMKETCNSGKWLREEEKRLAAAVYELAGVKPGENVTSGLSWALVSERVSTRSEKQCRTKWLNYLNWKQKGGTEWTREDDINLVLKIANLNVNNDTEIDWNDLASNWPSVRSPQWLRGKWWSLKRHCTEYQHMEFKDLLEYLKTVHLQNLKMKHTAVSNMKFVGLQSSTASNEVTTQYIPIQLNSDMEDRGDGIQYEVLHQTDSGMYLITQPVGSTPISLSGMSMGSDHIIVHTLPTTHITTGENVSVEMNPQPVILSSENDVDTDTLPLQIEQDTLPGSTEELQSSADFESTSIPEVTEINQTSSADQVGDLSDASTNFVQDNVMCTLSDPMLPSGGGDFIGSSSDAEIDKGHQHDSDLDNSNNS